VSPGFFKTLGTRILSGRDFNSQDNPKSHNVAIINMALAKRVIGTSDAVGRRFRLGKNDVVEVVGVVEDGKYETLTEDPKLAVFFPSLQGYSSSVVLLARSSRPEAEVASEIRQLIAHENPDLAIFSVGSLRQMLGLVYLPMRAAAIALGAFGILALMLAVTGIYGLSAYTVSRRSREIGIRMAIGAQQAQVVSLVFRKLSLLVAAGALLGLAGAFAAASILASIVYQASPRDPLVIGATSLTIALVSLIAALGPARRAIRIDPVTSLRQVG
jgi:ABC-type antimicrobial peptide transport system permease subunit